MKNENVKEKKYEKCYYIDLLFVRKGILKKLGCVRMDATENCFTGKHLIGYRRTRGKNC
jgi:hypothetical protein